MKKNNQKTIEELKKEIRRLKKLVDRDAMTAALNRHGFYRRAGEFFNDIIFEKKNKISKKKRKKFLIKDFSVLFIDVDNLKKVNDVCGHPTGDRVIKTVAHIINGSIRKTDFFARWGGDEFVVGLVGSSEAGGHKVAEAIRKKIAKDRTINVHKNIKVTASVGVAEVDDSLFSINDLIERADAAMCECKRVKGKNCVVKYSEIS
jgi:diguanylate cyclase (GGDEF)-like protein